MVGSVPPPRFQIASSLTKELCALVFGINTFLGTTLKSIIILIFVDKRGLALDVHSQVNQLLEPLYDNDDEPSFEHVDASECKVKNTTTNHKKRLAMLKKDIPMYCVYLHGEWEKYPHSVLQ